jgi:hypothetical protein
VEGKKKRKRKERRKRNVSKRSHKCENSACTLAWILAWTLALDTALIVIKGEKSHYIKGNNPLKKNFPFSFLSVWPGHWRGH